MSLILLGILNSQVTAGGGAAYDLLETQVLSSSAASVTFTGLGSYTDYKHLQIRYTARTTQAGSNRSLYWNFNSDTGTNYASHRLFGSGSSVTSSSQTNIRLFFDGATASGNTANVFAAGVLDILDFSNTSKNSTIRAMIGLVDGTSYISLDSGLWMNTNAITSITTSPTGDNLAAGSRFSLYGVK